MFIIYYALLLTKKTGKSQMAGRVVIDSKTFTEDFREERVELLQLSKIQQGVCVCVIFYCMQT